MKFFKRPFVFITLLLIIGIDFQSEMDLSIGWYLSTLLVLVPIIFLLEVVRKDVFKHFQLFCFMALFFLLGGAILEESRQTISSSASIGDKTLLIRVQEISSSEKLWRKSVCQVDYIVNSQVVEKVNEKILLYFDSDKVKKGDVLLVNTVVKEIINKNNPGEFDSKKYWSTKNIYSIGFVSSYEFLLIDNEVDSWLKNKFSLARGYFSSILEKFLSGDELAISRALVLGDKELLTKELRTSFSKAGAMHVLAVSGLHVGIVLYLLMFIFSKFTRLFSRKKALVFSLLIIWIYAGVTGFSPSVLRATIMFTILTVGNLFGRKANSINVLFFSGFILILWNPMIIYDIGFQLSYLAMIGIFTLSRSISKLLYIDNLVLRKAWEGTSVGVAAQLLTFPLTLYYFHQFPNYFVLTNVGMMIFAGLSLGLSLFLIAMSWFGLFANVLGVLLSFVFFLMLFFVQFIETLPGAVAKGFELRAEFVVIIYGVMLALLLFYKMKKVIVLFTSIALFLFAIIQYNRFQNINKQELVIFNSNSIIIALKSRDRIDCFYFGKNKVLSQVEYLIHSYEKIHPGVIVLHELNKGVNSVIYDNVKLLIDYNGSMVFLHINEKLYVLQTSYKEQYTGDATIIDMPYLQKKSNQLHLKEGAITIELN